MAVVLGFAINGVYVQGLGKDLVILRSTYPKVGDHLSTPPQEVFLIDIQ